MNGGLEPWSSALWPSPQAILPICDCHSPECLVISNSANCPMSACLVSPGKMWSAPLPYPSVLQNIYYVVNVIQGSKI